MAMALPALASLGPEQPKLNGDRPHVPRALLVALGNRSLLL